MKRVYEILRGARSIEWILLVLLMALLLIILLENTSVHDADPLEKRLQEILGRIEGAGNVEILVAKDEEGLPEGVLVVSDGAEDIAVNIRLQHAVHTLLGLEISRIEVVQLAGQRR